MKSIALQKCIYFIFLLLLCADIAAQKERSISPHQDSEPSYENVASLVSAMHATAKRARLMAYTFVQQTTRYDSLGKPTAPETWYEALQYPDHFRIDVGEPSKGRGVIYRNDSAYFFREGKLARASADPMPFMLLEGGLKCYPIAEVLAKMRVMGYDLEQLHREDFQGKAMYVIGAQKGDLKSKQIWIEAARLIPIRRIDPQEDGNILEAVYGGFQRLQGKWVETKVEFKLNGKLLQTESYSQLKARAKLKPQLFDPQRFGEWHWRK